MPPEGGASGPLLTLVRTWRTGGSTYVPPTEAETYERSVLLRAYVSAFAADQVRRGACTDLKLPEKPEKPERSASGRG
ncbi:hypothetical protein [Streptomyces fimicarius] [Streptomyces griseus]|nr:hypothetical protein GCM10010504_10580 [Streptomyces griseus]